MMVFLDSNVLIYYFEGSQHYQIAVRSAIAELEALHGVLHFVVSRLTMMECKVKPLRERNLDLLAEYEAYFELLTTVELTAQVVEAATQISAFHGLKTADALQAACAFSVHENCAFVTADAGFARVPKLHLKVISL